MLIESWWESSSWFKSLKLFKRIFTMDKIYSQLPFCDQKTQKSKKSQENWDLKVPIFFCPLEVKVILYYISFCGELKIILISFIIFATQKKNIVYISTFFLHFPIYICVTERVRQLRIFSLRKICSGIIDIVSLHGIELFRIYNV